MERFAFEDREFRYIARLVYDAAGIVLNDSKKELVYGRLAKRLRTLDLDSFRDYCQMLQQGDREEVARCVDAITTNVTSFFREHHHFHALRDMVVPELVERYRMAPSRSRRIWSAGCASGEEPYSIAITLKECEPTTSNWNLDIVATDLSHDALTKAESGIYRLEALDDMDEATRSRWFHRGKGSNAGLARVVPEIREMVQYRPFNLVETWQSDGNFDVVFCRNVMIYFSKEMRRTLIERFWRVLNPNGYLFIGHSETMTGMTHLFSMVGTTMYKKVS